MGGGRGGASDPEDYAHAVTPEVLTSRTIAPTVNNTYKLEITTLIIVVYATITKTPNT